MKKAIIGAGGFAREVRAAMIRTYIRNQEFPMFVDDEYYKGEPHTYPISKFNPNEYRVVVAIGDPQDRYKMVGKLPQNTRYFNFIDKSAQLIGDIRMGVGNIICAGTIITDNVELGNHCHLNLLTTIGHDNSIGDYFTTAPGAKISGNCEIYDCVYVGTNASIKQKTIIAACTTIGMQAAVVKDIRVTGETWVGVPAKKL